MARAKRIANGSTKEAAYGRKYEEDIRPFSVRLQLARRLTDAKKRCKKLGRRAETFRSFDLDLEHLLTLWKDQKGLCALSGLPMNPYGKARSDPSTVSLDRVDNNKGYTKGNVQLVTWLVNRARGEYSIQDFLNMCISVAQNNRRQT